jgi:hypothetical protein
MVDRHNIPELHHISHSGHETIIIVTLISRMPLMATRKSRNELRTFSAGS